jgi:L-glyceraldehyde reductase
LKDEATDLVVELSYQNQVEVGEGIKKAFKDIPGLKREDIFIVRGL